MASRPSSELSLTWQRIGIDPDALTMQEDGTLAAPRPELSAHAVVLPKLRGPDSTDEIAMEGLLGEGGMGMVFLGEQRSLVREVAVKVARPKAGAGTEAALLREARVTGALQHPGVVPVHMLQLATVIAVKTQLLDPRVFWICFVVLALGVLGLVWPAWVLELVGVAYASYFIVGALLSFETTPDGEPGAYVLRHMGQFTPRARRWFRTKPRS